MKITRTCIFLVYILSFFKFISNTQTNKTIDDIVTSVCSNIECSATPPDIEKGRLPEVYAPLHYDIKLQPFTKRNNMTCNGMTSIFLLGEASTNLIYFNAVNIFIEGMSFKILHPSVEKAILNYTYYCEAEAIGILLAEPIEKDRLYYLQINYTAKLYNEKDGLHLTEYTDKNGDIRQGIITDFSPADARMAFPCFDEPFQKTTFNITLLHPKNTNALSNMPEYESHDIDDYWKQTSFHETPYMPTYMVSMFIGNLEKLEFERISTYGDSNFLENAHYSLNITSQILSKFEEVFKKKFILPNIFQLAFPVYKSEPDENWGLLTYSEDHLAYDTDVHPPSIKAFVTHIISHVLVQQYFAHWSTPCWWDDLFINKGISVFFQYIGFKAIHPKEDIDALFVSDIMFNTMVKDDNNNFERTVVQNPHTSEDIEALFNAFTYGKAAIIIRMLVYHLGIKHFYRGLQYYVRENSFSCVTSNKLYDTLYEVANSHKFMFEEYYYEDWRYNVSDPDEIENPIHTFSSTWTKLPGYPILMVSRNYVNKTVRLYQSHNNFMLQGAFHIPITYTTGKEKKWMPNTKFIMTSERHEIVLKDLKDSDWIIFNLQVAGFYRVNYDFQNWNNLLEGLWMNHHIFPPINRAQILSDLWHLSMENSQYLSYFLGACRYLYFETDAPSIIFFGDIFRSLYSMTKNSKLLIRRLYHFTNTILSKVYLSFFWKHFENYDQDEDEAILYLKNRVIYLMCLIGNKDCHATARKHFLNWKINATTYSIPVEFKYLIFLYGGLQVGTPEDKEFLIECQNNPDLIRDYDAIALSLNSTDFFKHMYEYKFNSTKEDVNIHKLFFQSSMNDNIYGNYLIHDLDHRDAENSYMDSLFKSKGYSNDEFTKVLHQYFEDWTKKQFAFFLHMQTIRKFKNRKPYIDRGFTFMNKLLN